METLTRLPIAFLGAALVVAALVLPAVATAAPFHARVIWTQGDRAYLVARDSVWVTAGSSLRFFEKKKEVASGVVALIEDSTLVVAKITSGSLARVKHLDRIRVEAERDVPLARTALRVGYPSSARVQPFFECRRMVLVPGVYRADTLSARSFRLVRASSNEAERRLPDTLYVRLFDDGADEEIALERGELDAAVFWPGEASSHIREATRWNRTQNVVRTRGVVANYEKRNGLLNLPDLFEADRDLLDSLNTYLFRGDLQAPDHRRMFSEHAVLSRYEVDSACPGRLRIEAFLNRDRTIRRGILRWITYLDEPTDPTLVEDPQGRLFLIACPVISRPELRPYLESIDLSTVVNLFDCETAARKP